MTDRAPNPSEGRRAVPWKWFRIVVLWYLTIGLAVGIEVGAHQSRRFDPGFDPLTVAVVSVAIWPVVVAADLQVFIAYRTGALPRP